MPVISSLCSVSPVAVYKWLKKGRLPRTEWTGETNYAEIIAQACAEHPEINPPITREQLLQLPPRAEANSIPANQEAACTPG